MVLFSPRLPASTSPPPLSSPFLIRATTVQTTAIATAQRLNGSTLLIDGLMTLAIAPARTAALSTSSSVR